MHDDGVPARPQEPATPLTWLDEAEGERARAWAARLQQRARAQLGGPALDSLTEEIAAVLSATDRVPTVTHRAGMLYNHWTDATHPRGLWRRTTWESYAAGAPARADRAPMPTQWETLLDLDALSEELKIPVVWSRASVLSSGPLSGQRALLTLSEGGSDTNVTREYDIVARRFISPEDGGFHRPPSKGSLTWADETGSSVLLSDDFGPGSLSPAGFPRQVRRLHRGQDSDDAEVLVTAGPRALAASAVRDPWGRTWLTTLPAFYSTRIWFLPDDAVARPAREVASACLALVQAGSPASTTVHASSHPSAGPAGSTRSTGRHAGQAGERNRARDGVGPADREETAGRRDAADLGCQQVPAGYLATQDGDVVPAGAQRLDAPETASIGIGAHWLTIELRHPWSMDGRTYPAGTLLGAGLEDYLAGRRDLEVLFSPGQGVSLQSATWTAHHLVLTLMDDVATRLEVLTPPSSGTGPWAHHDLDLAGAGGTRPSQREAAEGELRPGRPLLSVSAQALDPATTDYLWLSASGWTTPSTLAVARLTDAGQLQGMTVVRQAPARYDARGVRVHQYVARSQDGTAVPYFEISRAGRPEGTVPSGRDACGRREAAASAPVLVTVYGAFGKAMTPGYEPVVGKAWLERGGTYVVANVRGGGEYGPDWHLPTIQNGRGLVVQDTLAVLSSLVQRGVAPAHRIGLYGSSAGGLVAGEVLARHPEQVGAVIMEAPLTDMRRYSHLAAGAAWVPEFGDPDDPQQWAWMQEHSPFHLLHVGRRYPPTLLLSSARDDRVHPAHARRMAWRLEALGAPVLYHEEDEGGHTGFATAAQRARASAMAYAFAWQVLGA